jgi:hypothetical protein
MKLTAINSVTTPQQRQKRKQKKNIKATVEPESNKILKDIPTRFKSRSHVPVGSITCTATKSE